MEELLPLPPEAFLSQFPERKRNSCEIPVFLSYTPLLIPNVPAVDYSSLAKRREEEPSSEIFKRVSAARDIQTERYKGHGITCNAQLPPSLMAEYCTPTAGAEEVLRGAFTSLGMTARSHDKVLKVARTIADLDGSPQIDVMHVAEAIQLRSLDRSNYFNG